MSKKIVVINAGSSSIKFKIFEQDTLRVIASGLCERIFVDGHFNMKFNGKEVDLNYDMPTHKEAIKCVLDQLKSNNIIIDFNEIAGVGHRVVLAGESIRSSVITTKEVKQAIKEHIKLAPLHNEPELTVIEIFQELLPNAVSVASFDNTFHLTIPPHNYIYPIDQKVAKQHAIRRYGFHGNSYRYINEKMTKILNKPNLNLIVCHLGNGASICAIKDGKSYATSMGLTPLEGVMMGTRCGDIDPSIPIYLARQGMSINDIDSLMNKKSGMQAVGGSSDMRDIAKNIQNGNEQAKLAMTMYSQRVGKYIVNYANQLVNNSIKDIDAIVFTAGVGENSMFTIQNIIDKVKLINLSLNEQKLNEKYGDYKLISDTNSSLPIYCVRTDEELMIAKDVIEKINK